MSFIEVFILIVFLCLFILFMISLFRKLLLHFKLLKEIYPEELNNVYFVKFSFIYLYYDIDMDDKIWYIIFIRNL